MFWSERGAMAWAGSAYAFWGAAEMCALLTEARALSLRKGVRTRPASPPYRDTHGRCRRTPLPHPQACAPDPLLHKNACTLCCSPSPTALTPPTLTKCWLFMPQPLTFSPDSPTHMKCSLLVIQPLTCCPDPCHVLNLLAPCDSAAPDLQPQNTPSTQNACTFCCSPSFNAPTLPRAQPACSL